MKDFLSKKVTVTIDRPLGSRHPEFDKHIYPINYGYIEGVLAGDGDYLDAYVLGVYEAVETFEGIVVGIVEREDDLESKLVVAPTVEMFSHDQIKASIEFQERFYESKLYTLEYLHKALRTTVKCLIKKNDKYLLLHEYMEATPYLHLPGGGMDFLESFEDSIRREISEELKAEVKSYKQITALSNVFEYRGSVGHEVSIIFEVELEEQQHLIEGYEMKSDATPSKVMWLSKEEIEAGPILFYPESMIPYL